MEQETKNKLEVKEKVKSSLPKYIIPSDIFYDYGDKVTAQHAIIYSYMLARYKMFKKMHHIYFERVDTIAQNCYCGTTAVKQALKVLETIGLLQRETLTGSVGNRNKYVVIDKYNIGSPDCTPLKASAVKASAHKQILLTTSISAQL